MMSWLGGGWEAELRGRAVLATLTVHTLRGCLGAGSRELEREEIAAERPLQCPPASTLKKKSASFRCEDTFPIREPFAHH